jgi:hypothetical protein
MKTFSTLLKTIVVLALGSIITLSGIVALSYWIAQPLSFLSVLAFVFGYFIILKPNVKHWAGFLVFIAEYRTIKAQMEERKAVVEKLKKDMLAMHSANEEDRERIAKEYKEKVDELFTKMKEKQSEMKEKQAEEEK